MKKQNALTVFYIVYFLWLFAVVFLTRAQEALGYFVVIVVVFYFVFLKDKWDILLFLATVALFYLSRVVSVSFDSLSYDVEAFRQAPFWIPLSWGVTALALKKFYTITTAKIS